MTRGLFVGLCVGFLYPTIAIAQGEIDLDSIRNRFELESRQIVDDFEAFSDLAYQQYAAYEVASRQAFSDYLKSIQAVWGADNTVVDTRTV